MAEKERVRLFRGFDDGWFTDRLGDAIREAACYVIFRHFRPCLVALIRN